MKTKETVFLNGDYIPASRALVPASSDAFLYGWGVFETIRYYHGTAVCLDRHLARLARAGRFIGIVPDWTPAAMKVALHETVRRNHLADARARITLYRQDKKQTGLVITAHPYIPPEPARYERGFSACIASFRYGCPEGACRIKSSNYLFYRLAFREAVKNGFDEALILNTIGELIEGSRTNLFVVKNDMLYTPELGCGCLDGITRHVVLVRARRAGIKVRECRLRLGSLYAADEAFITNSLLGVGGLTRLGKKKIAGGVPGRLTRFFMDAYTRLLCSV